ncbi:hypothetical protein WMY93_029700 [Mugilogobius chulae]|uniref:Bucky ball n=1 Tax=Mugilogobius chulae TaxID=88201 RepID=A0AAW0MRZ4_9GOBI
MRGRGRSDQEVERSTRTERTSAQYALQRGGSAYCAEGYLEGNKFRRFLGEKRPTRAALTRFSRFSFGKRTGEDFPRLKKLKIKKNNGQKWKRGQQRTHQRPFFYVQPPSHQPYYMYQQWQMNQPYGHYGLPAGFNFGRPCLNPYQYMQYPGFVFPHAPLYPMDYRRMFEPRFPSPHWDNSARHQPPGPPPQPPGHRETACSEAQTDPSDAIAKLIECLDKMQAGDTSQRTERELDSGVASQSSAMFSPVEEKKKEVERQNRELSKNESCLETPTSTFSTIAVYDGDSSRRSLEALSPRECWAGEEEPPLDSSSVQEEENDEKAEEQVVPVEKGAREHNDVAGIQTDTSATDQNVPMCEDLIAKLAQEEKASVTDLKVDSSFQILKLPFELASEAKGMSRLAQDPYYYNYLSLQSTHERMSVLSPSLDELSSRDELFSTDLDEVELIPRQVYAGGGGGTRRAMTEEVVDEIWAIGSKRFVCACCGKNLPRGASGRSKVHCTKMYLDEVVDSDEDARYLRACDQPIRVVVRKHTGARKTQPLPQRLTKSWTRRGPTRDQTEPSDQSQERTETQEEESVEGTELHRVCQERLCREGPVSEQNRWTEAAVRRKTTSAPLQRQELPQRKVMQHRPRDKEDDPPPLHWDRGASTRDPPC